MSEYYYTYVYGFSDDLVEVSGARRHELYVNEKDRVTVGGVEIDVTYDGEWSFEVYSSRHGTDVMIVPNDVINTKRFNDYTELVIIKERNI